MENNNTETEALARERIRRMLLNGETLKADKTGKLVPADGSLGKDAIKIPDGDLAAFYWYERDAELLEGEKIAMAKFFPQFQLGKLRNGKMYWVGSLSPELYRSNKPWYVQAVYQHNHPDNSNYGGSVRIYTIEPNLEKMIKRSKIGSIPHTLHDEEGQIYLCTANMDDVKAGNVVTSAASSLAWAAKWISSFELWIGGEISGDEFGSHGRI